MSTNKSGLKRVGYSDSKGGSTTWIEGRISGDSEITPDTVKTEDTYGSVYGGGQLSFSILFFDDSDYNTIEGFMTDNTEKYWHFEYQDGHTLTTAEAMNVFVTPATGTKASDGASAWTMESGDRYSYQPLL
jgi:hypothetical protein